MKKLSDVPTLQDIQEAHKAIAPFIHNTPVLTSHFFNQKTGAQLFFKCENFQKIGAFKMRGACCAVLAMTAEERAKGITTHSSGNHGQAVARSAQLQGAKAYIVMPENAPKIKVDAVRDYGAEVIFCHSSQKGREDKLAEVVERTGATFVHPYNDYNVIAGQATAAKELLEEVPDLDILMSPIGGGGLASGSALMVHYSKGNTKMLGAEPKGADDAFRSLQSGQLQTNEKPNTIADGLRSDIKEKTFGILKNHVQQIITVSDEEIIIAMRLVWERMKIIIEPSCAVPVAAILQQPNCFAIKKSGLSLREGMLT